jgi:hypothetical protein
VGCYNSPQYNFHSTRRNIQWRNQKLLGAWTILIVKKYLSKKIPYFSIVYKNFHLRFVDEDRPRSSGDASASAIALYVPDEEIINV